MPNTLVIKIVNLTINMLSVKDATFLPLMESDKLHYEYTYKSLNPYFPL